MPFPYQVPRSALCLTTRLRRSDVWTVCARQWTREEREDAQVYSDKTFTTRFRLPTKTDPKNVREDVWKVISKGEADRVLRRDETSLDVEREGNIVKRVRRLSIDRPAGSSAALNDRAWSVFADRYILYSCQRTY